MQGKLETLKTSSSNVLNNSSSSIGIILPAFDMMDGVRLSRTEQTANDVVESFFEGRSFFSFNKFDVYEIKCPNGVTTDNPIIGEKRYSIREEMPKHMAVQVGAQCKCLLVAPGNSKPLLIVHKPFNLVKKSAKAFDPQEKLIGRVTKAVSVRDRKMKILDSSKNMLYQIKAKRQLKTGNQKFVIYKKDDEEKAGYIRKYQKKEGIVDIEIIFPKEAGLECRCLFVAAAIFAEVHWFETDESLSFTKVKITTY